MGFRSQRIDLYVQNPGGSRMERPIPPEIGGRMPDRPISCHRCDRGGSVPENQPSRKILAKIGARVIDADVLSRQATEPGMPAVTEIAERFGPALVSPDGRDWIGRNLRPSCSRIQTGGGIWKLIVHRRVVEAIDHQLAEWTEAGFRGWVVLDVPIPVKRGFLDVSDEIWVVESPETVRVERVMKRSGLSAGEVRKRMAAQLGPEAYRALATRILPNDGQPAHLESLVKECLEAADSHRPCGT